MIDRSFHHFMTRISLTIAIGVWLQCTAIPAADKLPPEFVAAAEKARADVPLGGDFHPDPKQPALVAVGHGGRILLSRDDGKTWTQVHFGHLGSDHSPWATKAVAYTNGVFVVAIGWGAPSAWLASEDGVNWRHLTGGDTKLKGVKGAEEDPSVMPGTWGMAGGKGVFVSGGYMVMGATADFGKTITTFSLREFKDDPRPRKLVTHHVQPMYCGDDSGRFLALGNDRSTDSPVFGNLYASDDLGKTWTWLEPSLLNEKCAGYSGIVSNGELVVISDKAGANVFLSSHAGDSWQGPFATGVERAALSLVGKEFWLVGSNGGRASADGQTWWELPDGIPTGKIVASPEGSLINVDRRRTSILRSTDGGKTWEEVFAYEEPTSEHIHGAQGLRDLAFGYVRQKPIQ
jgi:photosystem II stability/assembly factor-like uncharacterized protein